MSNPVSTQVQDLVSKALSLPSANPDPSKWSLDVVLQVSVELAGLVKKGSKQQNFDLLLQVVNALLEQLQAKEVSSAPQDSSTVAQRWKELKVVVNTTLPVVFSYTSHLSVPRVVESWISCCVADVVELEQKVVAALPVVDEVAVAVDEVAVSLGANGVSDVVEKFEKVVEEVENNLPKVENNLPKVENVVVLSE